LEAVYVVAITRDEETIIDIIAYTTPDSVVSYLNHAKLA